MAVNKTSCHLNAKNVCFSDAATSCIEIHYHLTPKRQVLLYNIMLTVSSSRRIVTPVPSPTQSEIFLPMGDSTRTIILLL